MPPLALPLLRHALLELQQRRRHRPLRAFHARVRPLPSHPFRSPLSAASCTATCRNLLAAASLPPLRPRLAGPCTQVWRGPLDRAVDREQRDLPAPRASDRRRAGGRSGCQDSPAFGSHVVSGISSLPTRSLPRRGGLLTLAPPRCAPLPRLAARPCPSSLRPLAPPRARRPSSTGSPTLSSLRPSSTCATH